MADASLVADVRLIDVRDAQLQVELDLDDAPLIWGRDVDFYRSVTLALDTAHRARGVNGTRDVDSSFAEIARYLVVGRRPAGAAFLVEPAQLELGSELDLHEL
jgi:hypothetical protein